MAHRGPLQGLEDSLKNLALQNEQSDLESGNPTSPEPSATGLATPDSGVAVTSTPFSHVPPQYPLPPDRPRHFDQAHDTPITPRRQPYVPPPSYNRGSFRRAKTWVSSETREQQEFQVVRNSMRRLFKHSDVAKWRYADWISHKEDMISSSKEYLEHKLKMREEERERMMAQPEATIEIARAMGQAVMQNLCHVGNRGLVLGEKTIWCQNWQEGKEEVAPWPGLAEMKWEGDDRAKTSVGRFLPLPREQGPPTITWAQLQVVEQYPMDQVARIPTMEDIYLPVDEIDDEVKYDLITHELEDAIDAFLDS